VKDQSDGSKVPSTLVLFWLSSNSWPEPAAVSVIGMQRALTALRDEGTVDESKGLLVSFAERQRLVGKPGFDALEKKYAAH
jgi:hypothetical protein